MTAINHSEARAVVEVYTRAMCNHDRALAQQANTMLNSYLDQFPAPVRHAIITEFSHIVCEVAKPLLCEASHKAER